ncbi:hypothetical protein [Flavobacterium sp. UBA7682]|uniref:hypothetical protein n=1 Tax=Flavobacterium sp. UBA7682 TaxID=1946560 RepID=UPI0025BA15D8|nr:hypothetical protein [Flavobacterium sp. UBA7682]
MPTPPVQKYYPSISNLITLDSLPESVDFLKTILVDTFRKIHYKDFQSSVSNDGSVAFYSLKIVTKDRIDANLFFGLKFILNRDFDDQGISSFPVTLNYSWPIIAYLKAFDLENFSFTPKEFFEIGLIVLNISEEQILAHAINTLVNPLSPSIDPIQQFVNDINTELAEDLTSPIAYPTSDNKLQELSLALKEQFGDFGSIAIFMTYILVHADLQATKDKLKNFFDAFIPDDIEEYLLNIIKPEARVTLELSASIEFPRNILVPWQMDPVSGALTRVEDENIKAYFDFAKALLYADTKAGLGYQLELAGTLQPSYCEIGRTGILLQIDTLKLDLSKNTNIPEADADGRPEDFTGVYARAISVTLPARWFHDDAVQGTPSTGLRIGGYDLLIGTGGLSGYFLLETVPIVVASSDPYYFENKFEFIYPVTLFQTNTVTNVVEKVVVNDLIQLKQLLFPDSSTAIPPYSFEFPLKVNELPLTSGIVKTFANVTEYQEYLNSFPDDNELDKIPTLWKRLGGESGFRVGFRKFDITFKQNKVISSNIKGALEIDKFVYPTGAQYPNGEIIPDNTKVKIEIEGHLNDDGDFNLTASAQPPYPIVLPDIFTYDIKSLELGKEEDDFYIGTAGTLQFEGFLKDVMGLGPIEIERLRIYSDGSFDFIGGGSINLVDPLTLKLGPVDITVTALHFGSHQREIDGVTRKFNYFGFDGGVKVDPLGVEIRGDGVKFYYCTDDLDDKPHPYLHIQTLYLDLTIPAKSPAAIINGWISIPEPGVSKEYSGSIKLQVPSANLSGKADISLTPRYPAFMIDAEIDLPVPIPLGAFAIYQFRGLMGYRYVAEKEAIGMVSGVNSWYEYYKAPQRGINIKKFSGPEKTTQYDKPFSIGAGASFGTSADNGTVLNIKAMALLSIPSMFMIDGRASVLSARLGLEETKDPPFFAFVIIGDDSLEFGFGADFKMPTSTGSLLTVYADIQAGFFFKNQHPWYVNIGTDTNPITSRIISLLDIKSYVMLSASGIKAGARGEFNFKRSYFGVIKVKAHAFIEIGGRISFERPQIGAYLMAGVEANIKVLFVRLELEVGILFAVEAPRPFKIFGKFYFKIRIRVWGVTLYRFRGQLEVVWNFNKNIDRSAINPFINASHAFAIPELVRGVNMLSNETFLLAPLDGEPIDLDPKVLDYIIPLDTYIDIKTEKGLLPGNVLDPLNSVRRLIGSVNTPPKQYTDLIPPVSSVKGKPIRQVKHKYIIDHIAIKFWNDIEWKDYHPYEALYPNDPSVSNLKIGQFQKTDGQYNTVRLLATTPFSYTEQAEPGWYIPEQYGINASTIFCEGEAIGPRCTNFLTNPLHAHYYCGDPNTILMSNDVAFEIISLNFNDFATITDESNPFDFEQSLAFDNWNTMQIVLPEPSVQIGLKLSNYASGVKIRYYSIINSLENDAQFEIVYGNPNPNATNINEPYEIVLSGADLNERVEYNHVDWNAVIKIEIEPIFDSAVSQQIAFLNEQIADIEEENTMISLGLSDGEILSTALLEEELQNLICGSGTVISSSSSFVNRYEKEEKFNCYFSKEFKENGLNYIYSVGTNHGKGLISKINSDGSLVWEREYTIEANIPNLVFKEIIQIHKYSETSEVIDFKYIVYATTGDYQFLLNIDPENGEVVWVKHIQIEQKDVLICIAPSKKEFDFYLTISKEDQETEDVHPIIARIDSSGNLMKAIRCKTGEKLVINAICEDFDGLAAVGRILKGGVDPIGIIVKLNSDLEITKELCIGKPYTTLHDIKIDDQGKYLICGYDYEKKGVFTAFVNEVESDSFIFPNTLNHKSCLQLGEDGFYLLQFDDENGELHLLDFAFNILWSKEIHLNSGFNGIKNFTFNRDTEKITLNCYNDWESSLVVYTDKNLLTCLTKNLDIPVLLESGIAIIPYNIDPVNSELPLKLLSSRSAMIISLIKKLCASNECEDEDAVVCELYNAILGIYQTCLTDPNTTQDINFETVSECYREILHLIAIFNANYNLPEHLSLQIAQINDFLIKKDYNYYTIAWNGVQTMLDYLNEIGNCICECNPFGFTMIHEVCWMSLEDYEYNINIPSQQAIAEDAQATIDGITKFIQPIWRPDTSYYVHFVLKDIVDNGTSPHPGFAYTYGFTTAGPVGYFHTHDKATYGDLVLKVGDKLLKDDNTYFTVTSDGLIKDDNTLYVANTNGFIYEDTTGILRNAVNGEIIFNPDNPSFPLKVIAHPDKYRLTSLRQYIDYDRSYPNADGNLLSAKPLFYDDQIGLTTQINVFYSKAYATHFFKVWEPYKDSQQRAGRLKIVIKDPVEGIEIVNPPYLDYNPADTLHTHIPQAIEEWNIEEHPQVPFAISMYQNLFNSPNCIGQITTIKPASEYLTVYPKHLKPSKLYTAIVNNLFDVNHNGIFDISDNEILENVPPEIREVHKFVFQTSRYKDFSEQVSSFYLEKEIDGVVAQQSALFKIEKAFTPDEINATYNTIINQSITGFSAEVLATLTNDYQHPYDRVFEGILGFKPWDDPISTEVNVIRDITTDTIIALIVRNPEPFNNPKFSKEVLEDTIRVTTKYGVVIPGYSVLYSKDNSQAIIMNDIKNISSSSLRLKFSHKVYKDVAPGSDLNVIYPVVASEMISLGSLNN